MKKCKNIIFIFILVTLLMFPSMLVKAEQITLFEGVGHYAFATAGSNSATRGSADNHAAGFEWIKNWPNEKISNWSSIKKEIEKRYGEITNITGSKLNANGRIKSAKLYFYYNRVFEAENKVLLIRPDGKYKVFTTSNGSVDVTSFINDNNPEGWYYFSYISNTPKEGQGGAFDAQLKLPQRAWSLTAVYENDSLPIKYIKLIDMENLKLNHEVGSIVNVDFNSSLKLKNNFQLVGTIVAGGVLGYPVYDGGTTSQDKAWAVLSDGTTKQLSETNYNGKSVFKGRTTYDFANDIYSTERTTNEAGGELDIFDETLSSDFFGGKEIVGYKFEKTGSDVIYISNVGLAQEIESPNPVVIPKIEDLTKDGFKGRVVVKNTSEYAGCNTIIKIPLNSNIEKVENIVLSDNDNISYEVKDNVIIVTFNKTFKGNGSIEITFDAKLNGTSSSVELEPVVETYPSSSNECSNLITSNEKYKLTATARVEEKIDFSKTTANINEVVDKVNVPNTSKFISVVAIILGISLIAFGAFIIYKKTKMKNNK